MRGSAGTGPRTAAGNQLGGIVALIIKDEPNVPQSTGAVKYTGPTGDNPHVYTNVVGDPGDATGAVAYTGPQYGKPVEVTQQLTAEAEVRVKTRGPQTYTSEWSDGEEKALQRDAEKQVARAQDGIDTSPQPVAAPEPEAKVIDPERKAPVKRASRRARTK